MAYFLQQLANAAPVAALYALLAFGYAIAFAVTHRADLTYGALFGFAGQTFLLFTDRAYNALWLILPLSMMLGAVLACVYTVGAGAVIARQVMGKLATTAANTVIAASLGVALVLMELSRLAAETRSLWLPPFLATPLVLWRDQGFVVTLTVLQLINTVLMLLLVGAGHVFLKRSRWGRHWRAVSDDPAAAALCGIDGTFVFLSAYGVSAMIAAIAGILATASYGTMDFGAGLVFGVKILFIVAIGGPSAPVTVAGGAAAIAFLETVWNAYLPAEWRDAALYALLVCLLCLTRREKAGV